MFIVLCLNICSLFQVFGVGVHQGSFKSVQTKESLLLFPHIQSIKLTQTQACITVLVLQAVHIIVVSNHWKQVTSLFLPPQINSCLLCDTD